MDKNVEKDIQTEKLSEERKKENDEDDDVQIVAIIYKKNNIQTDESDKEVIYISSDDDDEDYYHDEHHFQLQCKFFKQKDWTGIKKPIRQYTSKFIIKELTRLVPYKMNPYILFCPINMPEVKVHCVHFVGTVISINSSAGGKYFRFTVCDGTSAIDVHYNRLNYNKDIDKRKKIDEKHERFMKIAMHKQPWLNEGSKQNCSRPIIHNVLPPFNYPPEMPLTYKWKLQHDWWTETNGGFFGKPIVFGDYLYIEGFCSIMFDRCKQRKDNISAEELLNGKLIVNTALVKFISEKEYNDFFTTWCEKIVKERY